MSTKIYNGFRLAEDLDPFVFLDRAMTAASPVRDRLDLEMLTESATFWLDRHVFGLVQDRLGDDQSPLAEAWWALAERQRDLRSKGRTNTLDYDPHSLTIGLGRDHVTGRILGVVMTDRELLRGAVTALDGVQEYAYWNNSDRPDNVTKTEWKARRDAWDRVLPGAGVPAESMACRQLRLDWLGIDPRQVREPGDVTAWIPTPELRARRIVDVVACRLLKETGATVDHTTWQRIADWSRQHHGLALDTLPEATTETLTSPTPEPDPELIKQLEAAVREALAADPITGK